MNEFQMNSLACYWIKFAVLDIDEIESHSRILSSPEYFHVSLFIDVGMGVLTAHGEVGMSVRSVGTLGTNVGVREIGTLSERSSIKTQCLFKKERRASSSLLCLECVKRVNQV